MPTATFTRSREFGRPASPRPPRRAPRPVEPDTLLVDVRAAPALLAGLPVCDCPVCDCCRSARPLTPTPIFAGAGARSCPRCLRDRTVSCASVARWPRAPRSGGRARRRTSGCRRWPTGCATRSAAGCTPRRPSSMRSASTTSRGASSWTRSSARRDGPPSTRARWRRTCRSNRAPRRPRSGRSCCGSATFTAPSGWRTRTRGGGSSS